MKNIKLGVAVIFLFSVFGATYKLYENYQKEQHRIYLAEQAKEKKKIFDFALDLNPNPFVPTGNIHVDGVSQSCRGAELRSRVDAFHRYVEHGYFWLAEDSIAICQRHSISKPLSDEIDRAKRELYVSIVDNQKEDLQDRMDAYRKLYSVDVPAHKARAEMMAKVESDLKRRTVYEEYMNNADMLLDAARRNPAMGMTIEQVESSKWGSPDLRRKMPRGDEVLDVLCYRWGRCLVFRRGLLVEVFP
jgi:hypothetical protein